MGARKTLSPLHVLGGSRTPFVKAFGVFANLQADELGVQALQQALKNTKFSPDALDEVVEGNVSTPPQASNIARVIALKAGVPQSRIAHSVSRNCASGMESIVTAWHAIEEGRASVIAAGGTESMSNIPMLFNRDFQNWIIEGRRQHGFQKLVHLTKLRPRFFAPVIALQVGLIDPVCGLNMGETAELLAKEFGIRRDEQDAFALASHLNATAAWQRGFFADEVLSVQTGTNFVSQDNGIRASQSQEGLAKLKPVFQSDGTVTAGNSSQLSDGACSLILSGDESLKDSVVKPLGVVRAYSIAGLDPAKMGLGPVYAIANLLHQTGKKLSDFELFEINEAFAAQVLACLKALESRKFCQTHLQTSDAIGEIPRERLNVNGGAIALGHPLGASGNRLILTLLRALREKGLRHGLASMCIGGGQGMAMWVEAI